MSKEILDKIRESEAEADRIVAEAEVAAALKKALETAKTQADSLTADAVQASQAEADAVAVAASAKMETAVQIVIGGLEAKCR